MSGAEEIRQAASLNVELCDFCAGIHINLVDDEGRIFASGLLPAEHHQAFVDQFKALMGELATRVPAPRGRQ